MAAPWRFLPCPNCCLCVECEGDTPVELLVIFTGWADGIGGCEPDEDPCTKLNDAGGFVLAYRGDFGSGYAAPYNFAICQDTPSQDPECCYAWTYIVDACGLSTIVVRMLYTPGGWMGIAAGHYICFLEVGTHEFNYSYFYRDLGTSLPDCQDIDWNSGWVIGDSNPCDTSAVTIDLSVAP